MKRFTTVFLILTLAAAAKAGELFVSPEGNDAWTGTLPTANAAGDDGPLASLQAARDAIRAARAADSTSEPWTVNVADGTYVLDETFALTAEDSGTADAPVVYRAAEGAHPRFLGGRVVDTFAPVTDQAVLDRLPEEARARVVQTNLASAGITNYGSLKPRGFGRGAKSASLELFFDDTPMTLARWPNDDWAKIASVPENSEGVFQYEGERPEHWAAAGDIWVHGYWTWDWAESFEQVASLDTDTKTITTVAPHGVYGYKPGRRYYFLNILEELDAPGEYYVDAASGMLYFWPPAPLDSAEAVVSVLETPMVKLEDMAHVRIEGLTFKASRYSGLEIRNGTDNTVDDCVFANLGTFAVSVNGAGNTVNGCELYNLGDGGISLSGGDRMTLEPGNNTASNNHIHDFSRTVRTYTPAASLSGVGNRVAHNLIHDSPHMAIGLGGNEHIIEYNEIHHVCMETHDAGAFYMGRDWTQRGNIVRFNFMHEMGHGDVQAIYLDDWASGTMVYGNVCHGARRGVLVGGGRDNTIENNIFVECGAGVHIDQRGLGWAKYYFDGSTTTLFDRLEAVNGTQPPYSEKYPELGTLLEDEPVLAKGNVIVRNISYKNGQWLELANELTPETEYLTIKDNYTGDEPGFVDADALNFRLKDDSPAYELGFKPIPWEKIGPQKKE